MKNCYKMLVSGLLLGVVLLAQADQNSNQAVPNLDQVYAAAHSGHLAEARNMMVEVLKVHPNSARAHFVESELWAKSGDYANARLELATAEKLDPTNTFANATALDELHQQLGLAPVPPAKQRHTVPWELIIMLGLVGMMFVLVFVRRQARDSSAYGNRPMPGFGGYPPNGPMPMGGMPMGGMPAQGGMGGSGLMGTLASGAALGAGMVAGEALAHRLVDGPSEGVGHSGGGDFGNGNNPNPDMGGQDFGVSGNSWDSDSGGDSWGGDSSGGSDWS